jgi:hypothetical protein
MDETTGDMTTRQGDTFSFQVSGVSDEWTLYFSVYKPNTREILFEIHTTPVEGVSTFDINTINSNLMTVPEGKKTEIYCYGIKRCKDGIEDTVIVGDKDVGDLNKILVYPLITEGDENGEG